MTLLAKDTVKFGILGALAAIFFDASLAHGLFWDNDPYWTYWITKTFLISTVFIFGTAFIGIGLWQGFALTAVHTAILEIYYQWLAPVGLPQEPEWLDFNHLWTTGVPAHYLVILTGYFFALWLWRRNHLERATVREPDTHNFAIYSLVTAVLILVFDGVITQTLLLRDFPGITFFVQHLLVAAVFIAVWTAYTGLSTTGWLVGSFMLALLWVTYSMYVGPRGLPLRPPTYSGYDDLWWKSFPGAFVSALIGWWGAGKLMKNRRFVLPAAATVLLVAALSPAQSRAQALPVEKGTNALHATARASGDGMRIVGSDPTNTKSTQPMNGAISVETFEMGNRWSHVQNTDAMHVKANFTAGGARYEVSIDKAMPRHPLGQYTTWNGVVYNHNMHGDTGIGTAKLPKMRPEIALWGWAEVKRNGQVLSPMAPAHVMVTSQGPLPGVMLEIDTEQKTLTGEPDGYINVMWHKIDGIEMPTSAERVRSIVGWIGIIFAALLFGGLAWREAD